MAFEENGGPTYAIRKTYEKKRKSYLILWITGRCGLEREDVAGLICPNGGQSYLANKLHRDSFSIDDVMTICAAEDIKLYFEKDGEVLGKINPYVWLVGYKDDLVRNINKFKKTEMDEEYKKNTWIAKSL